jgi:LysM repeat protein
MQVRTRIITTLGAGGLIAGLAATPTLASTHTVHAGDTLSGIAAHAGVPLRRVEAANPRIVDPNVITVGERVTVPDRHRHGARHAPGHDERHGHTRGHRHHHGRSAAAAAGASAGSASAGSASAGSASAGSASAGSASAGSAAAPATSTVSAPSSFQQCVAWRESSDTATDPDGLYGILPSTWASLGYSGTAGEASVALQNEAFQQLYAQYGTQPWAPSDGC